MWNGVQSTGLQKDYHRSGGVVCCLVCLLVLAGCATATRDQSTGQAKAASLQTNPFPSTYQVVQGHPVLVRNSRLLIGNGDELPTGDIYFRDGRIKAVGVSLVPDDDETTIIDATGKWVTPGIIDVHSHLGDYPSPGYAPHQDGNEATSPVTAEVWAEHSVWPQDPQFPLALAGGVTTLQILPGSANLIGGRGVTLKNVPARTVQAMKFPGAPYSLKMACGENPKRVYGTRGSSPSTRMGNVAGYRAAWIKARDYLESWNKYLTSPNADSAKKPKRDLQLETLAGVLTGDILVHNHCYRADEMAYMIDVANEFNYKITAFHHGVEAYKIADLLAARGICGALWSDWWGFKLESFDGIEENIALLDKAGGCAIVHSDSAEGIQHLNQEAAKAMAAGNRMGMSISRAKAITWITSNAAMALGVADQTGTIEPGKMADLVVWDKDPFSVYARAEKVYIDGMLVYDRLDPANQPQTDFELGIREMHQ